MIFLEDFNLFLFQFINASHHANDLIINFAIFIANNLLYWMIAIFAFFWLKGNFQIRKYIIKAFIFTSIALLISQIISHIFYHPRPFVMEVGRTIIYHAPNGSFPSDHMLIFSTIAFSYLFSPFKKLGIFLVILAWLVAWSRVYLGVHFPLDMIGAFTIAFFLNYFGHNIWLRYKNHFIDIFLKIHQFIFKPLINKGLIK